MKKLLLLSALLIFACSYGQGKFKITSNNELVWEKILNENIEIESQTISLKSTSKSVVYLRNNLSAELIVQHKGERTRLYVKNIKRRTFDIDAEEYIEDIVINKKGVFKKFFISRGDYKFLEQAINNAINSLIEENNYNW
jgi:hypothetical protein